MTEPGLWIQYDFGDGPTIAGRKTILWCAWLAWSRFRIVIPIRDKTLPTVTSCLDATFRRIGGVPAYVLTDNEKTVTTDHVAGIAVRNPEIVEVARHYGTTIRTCLPADPETKGGSEATVRIAKADLVPNDVNLREHHKTFGELEAACRAFCDEVNSRTHRATRRKPAERLAEERRRLHPLPRRPFTSAFGTTRRVDWESTISVAGVRYSVPHELIDNRVWARFHGDELIVTAIGEDDSAHEAARHRRGQPGTPVLDDAHYPPQENKNNDRTSKATSAEEAAFLQLGPGAASWLVEAGAAGVRRIKVLPAQGQDIGQPSLLKTEPERGADAVAGVGDHDRRLQLPLGECLQQAERETPLLPVHHVVGDSCPAASVRLVRPLTRQIQLPLQRARGGVGGGMDIDRDLAVRPFAGRSAVLAGHPD